MTKRQSQIMACHTFATEKLFEQREPMMNVVGLVLVRLKQCENVVGHFLILRA
jgi:hypothetical protein